MAKEKPQFVIQYEKDREEFETCLIRCIELLPKMRKYSECSLSFKVAPNYIKQLHKTIYSTYKILMKGNLNNNPNDYVELDFVDHEGDKIIVKKLNRGEWRQYCELFILNSQDNLIGMPYSDIEKRMLKENN